MTCKSCSIFWHIAALSDGWLSWQPTSICSGRNNGTDAIQLQSTDCLPSCTEHSPVVQKDQGRPHNHCHESSSHPWLCCSPSPQLEPQVTDGVFSYNAQPPFSAQILSLSLSLSFSIFHTQPLTYVQSPWQRMVSLWHWWLSMPQAAVVVDLLYPRAHKGSRQPAECCQRAEWFEQQPFELIRDQSFFPWLCFTLSPHSVRLEIQPPHFECQNKLIFFAECFKHPGLCSAILARNFALY